MAEENNKTAELVKSYRLWRVEVEDLNRHLERAKALLKEAKSLLGNHLVPKDAAPNEKFSIWVSGSYFDTRSDVLIEASRDENNIYTITRRK